ncbi:hypothetical protein CK203_032320 [Vitis vinifera]|uniref:Reverse transcriptase domain-containing protein n=1 Tax=Vitis vinifera TaxID=29760 RepID=A0A438IJP4_VITVI|nr:hypothetical protein CK203_032320 [Vitis vinifera]
MAMEALSSILKRAMLRGIIQGFLASGRGAVGMEVSHFLFANDTLIFCDSNIQHLEYLSWAFTWLEAISGLKTNLDKSELIPVEQAIQSGWKEFNIRIGFRIGYGRRVRFWKDRWCGEDSLAMAFPELFSIAPNKEVWLDQMWNKLGK